MNETESPDTESSETARSSAASTGLIGSACAPDPAPLAASIRRAVVEAGEAAFEDAGIQGLCADGRWEAAVAAMRAVDVEAILRRASASGGAGEDPHPPATG